MKLYLVWERESYCEYDVVLISSSETAAREFMDAENIKCGDNRFRLEEMEMEKVKEVKW